MKMATATGPSPILSLTTSSPNESNNKNCVEDEATTKDSKEENNDGVESNGINNPNSTNDSYGCDISTQEEAVEEFLAGDSKADELMSNMGEDTEDEVLFKSENVLGCGEEEEEEEEGDYQKNEEEKSVGKIKFEESHEDGENLKHNSNDSDTCLNKMQIMEDVREGCNVQPSSPGHANQVGGEGEVQLNVVPADNEEGEGKQQQTDDVVVKEEKVDEEEKDVERKEDVEENYSNASSSQSGGENVGNVAGGGKRKLENDDLPVKRLRAEIHENFSSRDKILNEFIEMADCNNLEQIQSFSEQLLAEVKTLNELAKEKEKEWNNIIHLKKLKEELLIRMQRKKHVLLINDKTDLSEFLNESQNEDNITAFQQQTSSILKTNLTSSRSPSMRISNAMNGERLKHRNLLLQQHQQKSAVDMNGSLDFRQRQRPTLDVQSIIADYRQRHPEQVPRRGRRIRTSQSNGGDGGKRLTTESVLNFCSMALGTGAKVRHNVQAADDGMSHLMNTGKNDGHKMPNEDAVSFKDMLQQFARLSQSERNELIQTVINPPPPYPEVTVLPVPSTTATAPTSSLLHGILTKTAPSKQQNVRTSFSPTLARLLTAPERTANTHQNVTLPASNSPGIHSPNMSISEILSTSKARNEITITPVDTQYESTPKGGGRSTEDEEAEDSADRLVIDESHEAIDARKATATTDNNSDNGDEIPQCQGCNQKPAQFVCAGCGNQWYCSRDCQVSAWDEHSEVCSG